MTISPVTEKLPYKLRRKHSSTLKVGEEEEEDKEWVVKYSSTGNDERKKIRPKLESLVSQRRRLNASWKSVRIIFRAC